MILDQIKRLSISFHPMDDFWHVPTGRRTLAGVDVNESVAMTYSACWACTRFIAGSIASLPFKLMRERNGHSYEATDELPLGRLLEESPNFEMSSTMWRATKIAQQVNHGNCYSEIERNGYGEIVALWPLHAARVKVKRDEEDRVYYQVQNRHGEPSYLTPSEVFHPPSMMSDDGIAGKGVIQFARETVGHALATERFGAAHFGNGARPSALLTSKKRWDADATKNIRREWNEIYQGPSNGGKLGVLWDDMSYVSIATSPEDSQFLGSRAFNVEEIARWYGVPQHLIGALAKATNNNIEVQGIEAVKFCLLPWILLWEQEANRKLLTPKQRAEGYYVKMKVDALERADSTTRTANFKEQFFNGLLTLNQWAKLEDRPPIGPLGDLHFVQSAMVPLEIAAKGPQPKADPAPKDFAQDSGPGQNKEFQAASLEVLGGILAVILEVEGNAAVRAAKKPGFSAWLETYYVEHAVKLKKAIAAAVRACMVASGRPQDTEEILGRAVALHVQTSKRMLLDSGGVIPAERAAARVRSCVETWKRTEIIELLKG